MSAEHKSIEDHQDQKIIEDEDVMALLLSSAEELTISEGQKIKTPEKEWSEEPDMKAAEMKEPEMKEPEMEEPEMKEPEMKEPEMKEPEMKEPEMKEPEMKEPEMKEPEMKEPEMKEPEMKEPEMKESEMIEPEMKEPEMKEPEMKEPEMKEPEVTSQDESDKAAGQSNTEPIKNPKCLYIRMSDLFWDPNDPAKPKDMEPGGPLYGHCGHPENNDPDDICKGKVFFCIADPKRKLPFRNFDFCNWSEVERLIKPLTDDLSDSDCSTCPSPTPNETK